jgi:hypothetical protein
MNEGLIKVVKKFLIGNVFEIDGFKYKFLSVEPYEFYDKSAFKFKVNVDLPEKNYSYVVAKFDGDIENILINLWKYFGVQFSYSIDEIYVNGVKRSDNDIYVTKNKLRELNEEVNDSVNRVYVRSKEMNIDFNASFKLEEYYLSDVNMTFDFRVEISDIKSEGKSIFPNMDTIDDLASSLWDYLNDNDNLRSDAEDAVYKVLEPQFKVGSMDDLYYSVSFYLTKIDGIFVDPKNWGGYIEREYFT